jgi:hypothetical protein
MHVFRHVCIYVCMHVCMYVWMYVSMYTCIHVCTRFHKTTIQQHISDFAWSRLQRLLHLWSGYNQPPCQGHSILVRVTAPLSGTTPWFRGLTHPLSGSKHPGQGNSLIAHHVVLCLYHSSFPRNGDSQKGG